MTFGQLKSYMESKLLESYNDQVEFKKNLNQFKQNILNNKQLSKVYSIYDQLSSPQGLSESESKEFLEEGLYLLEKLIPKIKLPKSNLTEISNQYSDLDTLIYTNKFEIKDRLNAKKNLINVISKTKQPIKENLNIPIKSMVSIANQTIKNFVDTMNEENKKEFLKIISEDTKVLEEKYDTLKEDTINKLSSIIKSEEDPEIKGKISETIEKIELEEFNQISFLKLKTLSENI